MTVVHGGLLPSHFHLCTQVSGEFEGEVVFRFEEGVVAVGTDKILQFGVHLVEVVYTSKFSF